MNFTVNSISGLGGPIFRPDPNMIEKYDDWSGCRSIPRAKRRHAQGIRTRMRVKWRPRKDAITIDGGRTYYLHPEAYTALKAAFQSKSN